MNHLTTSNAAPSNGHPGTDRALRLTITENVLTDGSKTYDVVVSHPDERVAFLLPCYDQAAATDLAETMNEAINRCTTARSDVRFDY